MTGENAQRTTIDPAEVAQFAAIADEWWDPNGKFRPLHRFNPVRLSYLRSRLGAHFGAPESAVTPFKGLRLLDIGCGGGLLSEPMARLGASVVGADAAEKNVKVAALHAEQSGLAIDYRNTSAEDLARAGERFDIVLNMEVVEHVADLNLFMAACAAMVKPGGVMVTATLNRTMKAFALAIVGAEYVLGWLPRGTHKFQKFVRPSELAAALRPTGLDIRDYAGVSYNPLADEWRIGKDVDVNYMAFAVRPA
ncbi:bifunctional 2-polyprenyl-6-hydroxyphenol methylase/3-demethylubiquinol 3-O-methyltransferase UbiG [Zavarzinia compransoris]|uniref:Ubiquinone biosynthesis O-methyltransferase n=1 Tax=Zavarzinia compransoris TaxID=1264899 RepID=A0A317EAQ6_9PROT|nr:bifunctional 2-polyprenyl-6-hydroxyphenol methylase/3-demethylubiquinol 3-O-methyltransferase UbiG [Zavarzinia compransoris]PWR22383.1 bifunctional 3-demethylubiquinol 3-O-methyltransferase/2-polyprenyl-6-hydroxyphenol methylase [Zavarzinia compransoris]TDP46846.1 3-demethylubiquinone-9 3-methyltransferase [Zavarzinia compransoris]